jgi:hypothetical protein
MMAGPGGSPAAWLCRMAVTCCSAAVPGRVDGGGGEPAGGHVVAGTGQDAGRPLVLAAAVTQQHQGHATGAGGRRPQHAGDVTQGEGTFDDAV